MLNVVGDVELTHTNVSGPEGSRNMMFAHIRGTPGSREADAMNQLTKADVQDLYPEELNEHVIFDLKPRKQPTRPTRVGCHCWPDDKERS